MATLDAHSNTNISRHPSVSGAQRWQGWNQFGMTGVFLSVPRYDRCTPLLHPSSCMLVNHGPSQQSSKEEYKPWKWGATARYYTSHTKTMIQTRKSVPRSSGQLDHTKTSWPSQRDADCSGIDISPVHQVWPKPFCTAQWKGEEDKADRRRGGKTTSGMTGLEFAKSQRAVANREKWS